jgi:uncharacterized membrane protein YeaQ/YmgE (transglycosylase-associated protein family)
MTGTMEFRHGGDARREWAERQDAVVSVKRRSRAQEDNMYIIGWIFLGLVVGIVAKLLMPGRDPGGFFITALLGIVGALVGGFLGRVIGWYGDGDPVGFVMAVIGSIILLAAYRLTIGRTAHV